MNKSEEVKENNGLPKIVILNSCSPSKEVAKKKSKSFTKILEARIAKKHQDMKNNLAYRGKIYWQGRKRFCALRNLVAIDKTASIEPLLPYYDAHNQFTRVDQEDLASTHKFIGDLFAEEDKARNEYIATNQIDVDDYPNHGIGPITFGKELFFGLYTVAATDRRQTIMKQLREYWSQAFGSGREQAWSWKNMVDSWEEMRKQPLSGGPTAGGGKKRRRTHKKRKTHRKRKKRTRKRTRKKRKRRKRKRRSSRRKKN